MKSRYGAKRVIFYYFQPRSKAGAGPHVKSRCRANGSFLLFSAPVQTGAGLGHLKVSAGQIGDFLLPSALIQDQGTQKVGTGQTDYFSVIFSHSLRLGKLKSTQT